MESVSRNVILDLLPAYISGEASEESRSLVEEYAKSDREIERLIRTGKLETEEIAENITPPDDLEMKTLKRVRRSIRRQIWLVAIATASVLMIPLIAMNFTDEVNWNLSDFVVMGILLLGTGTSFVVISKISESAAYKAAVGIALAGALLLLWANLAVGIIGSAGNPINFLYFGVITIGVIGAFVARFKARGMSIALFITAFAQSLVLAIALINQSISSTSLTGEILLTNAFFIIIFMASAVLFRLAK